jgi:branched-chain amino acid transport system ATP-binding protein
MGLVQCPEGRGVFPNLTVEENLDLGAYVRRDQAAIHQDRDRVYTLFSRLKERRGQSAGTLSGGEQQMLAIGRALMAKPQLLLLDEPSLGLAPQMIETIFDTIEAINREGTTILLVEQNAQMALEISHTAYVLETGKVLLEGPAAEVARNPKVQQAYLGQ